MAESRSAREGRQKAEAVRFENNLGFSPIRDLFGFIERTFSDVYLARYPMNGGPEGALLRDLNRWFIIVNTYDQILMRQRFTASHELAHYLFDGESEPLKVDESLNADGSPVEVRANAFAVHLILPADALRRRFHSGDFDLDSPADLVQLSMEYGLSLLSLSWHLKRVCGISESLRAEIASVEPFRVASRLGFTDRIKQELAARGVTRMPRRIISLAAHAFDRELIDESDLREIIRDEDLAATILDPQGRNDG